MPSIYHSLIVLHHKLDPDVGKAVKEAIDQRRQDVDHDGASDIQFHRLVDIIAAGCDAGIRYGEHLAQDMIAVPIGPPFQKLALAASPRYLDERVPPVHPSDLLTHDCIRLRFSSGALTAWEFECGDQSVTVDPPGRLIIGVDDAPAAIELACAGRGIICTFENWLDPALRAGALKPVLKSDIVLRGGSA